MYEAMPNVSLFKVKVCTGSGSPDSQGVCSLKKNLMSRHNRTNKQTLLTLPAIFIYRLFLSGVTKWEILYNRQ